MNTQHLLYTTELTDREWALLEPLLPPESLIGRPRLHALRTILNAIFYQLRTGCLWPYLPPDFPPWQTVHYHFRQVCRTGLWALLYKELRIAERCRVGKDPHPSAAIMDAQSVKTIPETSWRHQEGIGR